MSVGAYKKKIIASGNILEVYEYENNVLYGYEDTKKSSKGRQSVANEEDKEDNREKVLQRARRDLRRIINSNVFMYGIACSPKFVTLTFRDDVVSLELANYEFEKFIKRLGTYHDKRMKYAAVPEIQKERFEKSGQAVWHYHVIFFNMPYIRADKLGDIWGNGFIKVNRIDRVDNVGAYICKYMTKDNKDLTGKKCYFTSRGLYKPIEVKEKDRVESLATALPAGALAFESTFENEYNKVIYKQYNMNKVKIEEVI